jgi:hypothetical protein
VRHLDPTAPNFFDFFSGDFRGVRGDNSLTEMISYGVLRVELHGANGEKLNLAAGKTATLSYPVPGNMAATAPPEMPLWWFDEAKGMWKEEGKATMQGNSYVGTVSHFSEWNCDVPALTATLRVHVTCNNEGVAGVLVRIGERTAITDTNGYASRRVPAGMAFTVKVHAESNDGLESAEIAAGPFSAGTTNQLDVPLTTCPAYIYGNVHDCGDSPIDATVIAEYDGGGFAFGFAEHGRFRIRGKASVVISHKAISPEGIESEPKLITALNYGEEHNAGVINTCTDLNIKTNDYVVNPDVQHTPVPFWLYRTLISADGLKTFVFYSNTATVVNTATGKIIRTIQFDKDSTAMFPSYDIDTKGSLILVATGPDKYTLYDVNIGRKLLYFKGYRQMILSPDGSKIAAYKYKSFEGFSLATLNASTGAVIKETNVLDGQPISFISHLAD